MSSSPEHPPAATTQCYKCDTTLSPDAQFCPNCGAQSLEPTACSACGEALDRGDRFCSACGTPRSEVDTDPAKPHRQPQRSTNGQEYDDFREHVEQHVEAGWEIEHDYGDRATVVDRDIGSIGVHLLLLLFTGGLGNLAYGWYSYVKRAERRHLSIDEKNRSPPKRRTDDTEGPVETALSYALSALLMILAVLFGSIAIGDGASLVGVGGALVGILGLAVAPPIERQLTRKLGRRHAITEFGRTRTVDHRVVKPIDHVDESCVVCGEEFDGGMVRRRRDETVLAGLPVVTHELEHNHYCADCARSEFEETSAVSPSEGEIELKNR